MNNKRTEWNIGILPMILIFFIIMALIDKCDYKQSTEEKGNQMAYLTEEQIREVGFKSVGTNVLLSEKASIYNPSAISIGDNVRIDDFVIITAEADVNIGNYVHIAAFTAILGRFGADIGDFVGLSFRTTLLTGSDDFSGEYLTNPTVPDELRNVTQGKVHIGEHTIVGSHTVIFPGVIIGDGVAVGALSLVNRDLASWAMYVGIPCLFIKNRSHKLLELERKLLYGKI